MIVELLLIRKLLDSKTVGSKSTPTAVSPSKLFGRNGNIPTSGRIPKPPTKKGPALGLKKYF
jgi:hypothetical protein